MKPVGAKLYIKRAPLGQGNLTFGKRRRRYPLLSIILYLLVLALALFVFVRKDAIQPTVLKYIGPAPPPTPSLDELIRLGEQAYMEGDLTEAIEYYRQAAEVDPTNVQVLTDWARLLLLADQWPEALSVAERAVLIAPESPHGYAIKARVLDWMGQFDQAQIEALRALELDPDYALAHAYLSEIYTDLGRYRQALEQAEMAVQLDPYSVDARRNYAYVLEHYGDYPGAIQQYLQALQLHPNMLDLWYGLARNYRGTGQFDLSIQTFNQIIIRTPDDPLPYVELGKTYFTMRDDAAAQEYFEQAVELVREQNRPRNDQETPLPVPEGALPERIYMPAWTRLGMVYFTRRNYESALDIFEEAIAWGEANNEVVPIEAYYVTAAAYYYLDICRDDPGDTWPTGAVDRALTAFNIYQDRRLDDEIALENILKVFVLCRYAQHPYIYTGPGFNENGFPIGYTEPDIEVQRPGLDDGSSDGGSGN